MANETLQRIVDGRTDMVFDFLAEGHAATWRDEDGVSLASWCAYYGDVSALRFLLASGESIQALGENLAFMPRRFTATGGSASS